MNSTPAGLSRASSLALALASGVLTALAFPLVLPMLSLREIDPAGHLELVAWISLVPALLALREAKSARWAALLGLVAGAGCFSAAIYWVSHAMTAFGGLSTGLALFALSLLVLFMATHWALAFALSFRLRQRLGWPLWAHLPIVWAATELLRNYLFSGFPWANLGYTQARTVLVAQLASLTGVYGVAALVVLVNAVAAEAIAAWRAGIPLPRWLLAGTALLLAAVVGFGALNLARVRARMAAAPTITVGVVQPNVDQSRKNSARENREYILGRLVPPTLEADRAGADLVAWPEAAYPLYVPPTIRSFDQPGAGIPPLARAHVLVGAATIEWLPGEDGGRVARVGNQQFLLSPGLDVLGSYQKNHLVPFGEYVPAAVRLLLPFVKHLVPSLGMIAPGDGLRVLEFRPSAALPAPTAISTPTVPTATPLPNPTAPPATPPPPVRLAPMICFDAIFPEINVAFARKDPAPEILVNATNDAWYGYSSGPYQFLTIVRMRAIEAGRAVVRPAYAGVSAVILPTGELAPGALEVGPVDPELAPDRDEPARLLLAQVPRLQGHTPYTTIGDLFAYSCALAVAAALVAARLRRSDTNTGRP
jgi:apolipoprotein N-acyltransferase